MRVVVAPDSYKGCLMAWDVAQAISRGVRAALPEGCGEVIELPVGDGGEGTARAIAHAVPGAELVQAAVHDPLRRPVTAEFAMLPGRRAVVEMAAASGLGLLAEEERDPLAADTYGTGELVRAALDRLLAGGDARPGPDGGGAKPQLILGVGGSATVDGGAGMLAALGVRFGDRSGHPLEATYGGGGLSGIGRVDLSGLDPRLGLVDLVLASDVGNPLLGSEGAAAVFGPQKGATPAQVVELDEALAVFRRTVLRDTGRDLAAHRGAGAAGGLGGAAVALLGAAFRPGIELALELADFDRLAQGAALVITGEGRYDCQTLSGKAVQGVAAAAARAGVPLVVLAGSVDPAAEWHLPGWAVVLSIADGPMPLAQSRDRAAGLLTAAARRAVYLYALGRR